MQRAEHVRRELHFARIVNDGAIYAQPFSEGSAAAAGRAPFGTTGQKGRGGWLINAAARFSPACRARPTTTASRVQRTKDEHPDARADALHQRCRPRRRFFHRGWNPLGMRGTVSRNLQFKDVFHSATTSSSCRAASTSRRAQTWPAMFFTL